MLVYTILSTTPVWALFAVLFVLTYGAIFVGRHFFEGVPYQVSYSAFIGDAGLLVAVLIAATVLQHESVTILPEVARLHVGVALFAFIICSMISFASLKSRNGKLMDIYHDVFIAPVVVYLGFTLLPVIYQSGNQLEKGSTSFAIALWLACVYLDAKFDRMNQRRLLERMGLKFPNQQSR